MIDVSKFISWKAVSLINMEMLEQQEKSSRDVLLLGSFAIVATAIMIPHPRWPMRRQVKMIVGVIPLPCHHRQMSIVFIVYWIMLNMNIQVPNNVHHRRVQIIIMVRDFFSSDRSLVILSHDIDWFPWWCAVDQWFWAFSLFLSVRLLQRTTGIPGQIFQRESVGGQCPIRIHRQSNRSDRIDCQGNANSSDRRVNDVWLSLFRLISINAERNGTQCTQPRARLTDTFTTITMNWCRHRALVNRSWKPTSTVQTHVNRFDVILLMLIVSFFL